MKTVFLFIIVIELIAILHVLEKIGEHMGVVL